MRNKTGLGSKKDLNADLNLTPFIDLLSTCVCFLLVTAVWIEIGTVEIKQSHGTDAKPNKKITYDLDVVYQGSQKLRLNLKKNGRTVKGFRVKGENFEDMMLQMNTIVQSKVLNFKNKAIEIASATVTPRSEINYGNLVKTLDVLRKNKIVNIGVLSARGK